MLFKDKYMTNIPYKYLKRSQRQEIVFGIQTDILQILYCHMEYFACFLQIILLVQFAFCTWFGTEACSVSPRIVEENSETLREYKIWLAVCRRC